ncbi:MAG: hypothetical protein JAY90_18625 [Candidatus Thiodiazotropha lotti]|nr:hypothetical protein [Candidatus Thiodiazotropha lotti]
MRTDDTEMLYNFCSALDPEIGMDKIHKRISDKANNIGVNPFFGKIKMAKKKFNKSSSKEFIISLPFEKKAVIIRYKMEGTSIEGYRVFIMPKAMYALSLISAYTN